MISYLVSWAIRRSYWYVCAWIRSWFPYAQFEVTDKDGWRRTVANNRDGYGASAIRFAAEWAHDMEQSMRQSEGDVASVAEACMHRPADKFGLSGFQYGCAVSLLSQVWVHGAALMEWQKREGPR